MLLMAVTPAGSISGFRSHIADVFCHAEFSAAAHPRRLTSIQLALGGVEMMLLIQQAAAAARAELQPLSQIRHMHWAEPPAHPNTISVSPRRTCSNHKSLPSRRI
jgi:hypothetical protein